MPNNANGGQAPDELKTSRGAIRERGLGRPNRGGRGRPTRADALRRDARLLDVSTKLFMERGFDGTSIDAVADAAAVSKCTVYARYGDKRGLFTAVLMGSIGHWLAPLSAEVEAQAIEVKPKDIKTTLHDLSRQILSHASTPEAAALQRIIADQAIHFPELARLAHEDGWLRAVRGVASLLRQAAVRDQITVSDPELSAGLFLDLVLGPSRREAFYGISGSSKDEELHRKAAVELFLAGIKAR